MTKHTLLVLLLTAGFSSSGFAAIYDIGGMYTYHYRDGRYADWGDFARHGARIAIQEINQSGILGEDRLRMTDENTVDYHCWPENAALIAETLMKKGILVLTGEDCSGPAVEIASVGAKYKIPVIKWGHITGGVVCWAVVGVIIANADHQSP